ncbi:diaminopimelate decarboxylase [Stackebrandtia endophytica]|uniref:diaminopimelate decarboxylase n=1 Tax=Stackebrandtia endophytica TaxID=1496996 RepID=UPI00114FDB67|nr:diaminopimelate decarboxylase [Stackebrandtia endophytica]
MRSHEAGVLHGDYGHSPSWLRPPTDVNDLLPQLWAQTVQRGDDGRLTIGGVSVEQLAQEYGTPAYLLDEADFKHRLAEFRDAFAAVFDTGAVYYAGKAFLCKAVARWVAEAGVNLDICTEGELAVALAADFPADRLTFHGNNKSPGELLAALEAGVGRIVLDSYDEIDRLTDLARRLDVSPAVLLRVKAGVEAHTHEYIATAHEDQKFGLSLTAAAEAAGRIVADGVLRLNGLHSHIGSQIFDTGAFEVAARRVIGLHHSIQNDYDVELPQLCLGGGFGMAYTTQDDPRSPSELADALRKIIDHECAALGIEMPAISVEPGRAICGPSTFTLYRVGTVKPVDLDGGRIRSYVSVDGGMSDNLRTALYDASYSATLASRLSEAPPVLARVVGKHCESGDIVVKDEFLPSDVTAGDLIAVPGTGAYCRSMASNYNHVPRPPVIAVADGAARVIVRRETVADLLRLDVG